MIATAHNDANRAPEKSEQVDLLRFPRGMVGFHNIKEFTLAAIEEAPPFMLLSAVEEPELAFIVVRASEVEENYYPKAAPWVKETLEFQKGDKPIYLLVVNLDGEGGGTVNLRGPILINPRIGYGAQMALDETFPLRKALLQ